MAAIPLLYVVLSPHGYGHAAMTVPVLNYLRQYIPNCRFVIETNIPRTWFVDRLHGPFEYVPTRDFGMVMRSATEVDTKRSHAAYLKLHTNWPSLIIREANKLYSLRPDALLTNISYLAIAAASLSGIPSIALCSLNWADVYRTYCNQYSGADQVLSQMEDAYRSAQVFLRALPAMSMSHIHHNIQDIGPIVCNGYNKRDAICYFLHVPSTTRIGLLAFGGIYPALSLDQWPHYPGWLWIIGLKKIPDRYDMIQTSALPLPFIDLLTSADVVLTKPGYGTFTESAYAHAAVLYSCRGNWPESLSLTNWLQAHTHTFAVSTERLWAGDFADELDIAQSLPHNIISPPQPTGINQATSIILSILHKIM